MGDKRQDPTGTCFETSIRSQMIEAKPHSERVQSNFIGSSDQLESNGDASQDLQGLKNHRNQMCVTRASDKPNQSLLFGHPKSIVRSMATTVKLIKSGSSRPLRQINVVGQLNHSANKGLLLIMVDIMVLILFASILSLNGAPADAISWPFNRSISNQPISLWPTASKDSQLDVKRVVRHTENQPVAQVQPVPPPISKQFHYFWNHDRIEPKTVAEEANKILQEAQLRTDQIMLNGGKQALVDLHQSKQAGANNRLDSFMDLTSSSSSSIPDQVAPGARMGSGFTQEAQFPISIPTAIQQQLTALVLQLQRQQQMSMMMQPRFEMAKRRSSMIPLNPMNQYWMSGSSQHPILASPQNPLMSPMFAAESLQLASSAMHPYNQASLMQPSIGGVPIYGPFLVAPSIGQPIQATISMTAPNNMVASPGLNSKSSSPQPQSKFASSFLGRRRSWPLFGLGSSFTDRGSFLTSGSQLRPIIAVPPNQISQPPQVSFSFAPESVALLESASNQLVGAIADQMQQKLVSALAQTTKEQQQNIPGFAPTVQQIAAKQPDQPFVDFPIGQKPISLQAPYLVAGPTQMALNPLLSFSQGLQAPVGLLENSFNFSGVPFGSRLKKRHLSPLLLNKSNTGNFMVNTGDRQFQSSSDKLDNWPVEQDTLASLIDTTIEEFSPSNPFLSASESFNSIAKSNRPVKPNAPQSASIGQKMPNLKRIVKKDASILMNRPENRLNDLFMVLPNEPKSPSRPSRLDSDSSALFHGESMEGQTQLRRLKRSTGFQPMDFASKSSSSWKSIPKSNLVSENSSTNNPQAIFPTSYVETPRVSPGRSAKSLNSHWSPNSLQPNWLNSVVTEKTKVWSTTEWPRDLLGISLKAANELLKRQSEINEQSNRTGSKQLVDTLPTKSTITTSAPFSDLAENQKENQDKTLKIKRLTANASVMHNPVSKARSSTRTPAARGIIITSSPVQLTSPSVGTPQTNSQESSVDPMSSSLSESARVVNYFQNVKDEKSASGLQPQANSVQVSQRQQVTVSQVSSNSAGQSQQISVGFSMPQKSVGYTSKRTNETHLQGDAPQDIKRQPQTQAGNEQANSLSSSSVKLRQNYADPNQGQQLRSSQQQQELAAVNNVDISSAATGNQAYVNNMQAGSISGQNLNRNTPNQMSMNVAQAGASNLFRNNRPSSTDASMLNILLGLNYPQRSSQSNGPIFGATSQTRQSVMAPGNRVSNLNTQAINSNDDRTAAADQSYNINEELLAPQSGGQSVFGPSMNENFSQDQPDRLSSQPYNPMEPLLSEQNNIENNMPNSTFDNGYGSKIPTIDSSLDQSMDLSRFNQQSMYPTYNQSEGFNFAPDSSMYNSNGLFGQQALQNQPVNSITDSQSLLSVQGIQPMSSQQQLYSQQLHALGNAVSNYNQQRFNQQRINQQRLNQHLHDVAMSSLSPQNRAIFSQSLESSIRQRNHMTQPGFYMVDEDAAAGAAAAAGIPSYPNDMAIQNQAQLNELNGMLMSGSENREQNEDGKPVKKAKKKSHKHISHHYHFNSLGSPFEDPDNHFGSLNPLEIANSLQGSDPYGTSNQPKQKPKANKDESKEEEEKPKKKGFLRRFSLKKLFKKLKKDKKKETESEANNSNGESAEK